MKRLLIATTNKGKLEEFSRFLSDLPIQLVSLEDLHETDDVVEDGESYEENVKKKALFYSNKHQLPAIADDGGVEIAALNNLPGVHSKRWLGKDSTEEELFQHLLQIAITLPKDNKAARFITAVALALPSGEVWVEHGVVEGVIAEKPFKKISTGYPYRSFFFLPQLSKYYHDDDLSEEEMQTYNHRLSALTKLMPILTKKLLS